MIYFITGVTGTVVPLIVEELMRKDDDPRFYFAIRNDSKGNGIQQRFESLVETLDLDAAEKRKLSERSTLVRIDVEKEKLGIEPGLYNELVTHVEKILHGAADVRFDQPYDEIKISNVVFSHKIYDLFDEIKNHRKKTGQSDATLYYISTGYAYGIYKKKIPEDFPDFKPGKPDNTYARTKAEAKVFILDKINRLDDRIVLFEPTIIGGSAKTGKTKTYNLHYVVLMLGYLGKLPFFTAADNQQDIVPVDWVADVISDIMAKDEFHQGVIRLACGPDAATVGDVHDAGYEYFTANDPVPGHEIPKIAFVPRWFFYFMINVQKLFNQAMYKMTGKKKYRKMVVGVRLLEGYFPYITRYKVFENAKSTQLLERYTDCPKAPILQNIKDKNGNLIKKGYIDKILADALETGWGGLVDYDRVAKQVAAGKRSR
jgi:thioester reductase-like protein